MPTTSKLFLACGALAALLAVVFGAFGAHTLRGWLTPDLMAVYQTAVQYHFYHACGLILVALVAAQLPQVSLVRWAGWGMVAGIVLFSGSLYALALTGVRVLGAITPLGGVAFILAWGCLLVGAIRAT